MEACKMKFAKIFSILSLTLLLSPLCNARNTVYTTHFRASERMIECKIWDMATGRKIKSVKIPSNKPLEVSVSYDCKVMAILRNPQTIEICDITQDPYRKTRTTMCGESNDKRNKLKFGPGEGFLFFAGKSGYGLLNLGPADFHGMSPGLHIRIDFYQARDIALNHDNTILARALDGKIEFSDSKKMHRDESILGASIDVQAYSLAFNHDSTLIAFSTDNKKVKIIDAQTGDNPREIKTIDVICPDGIQPKVLSYNHDGTILAVQVGEVVNFYNTETSQVAYVSNEFEQKDEQERFGFAQETVQPDVHIGLEDGMRRSKGLAGWKSLMLAQ